MLGGYLVGDFAVFYGGGHCGGHCGFSAECGAAEGGCAEVYSDEVLKGWEFLIWG